MFEFLRSVFVEIGKYSIYVGAILVVSFVISIKVPFVRYFFEEEAPKIQIGEMPVGLGNKAQQINFKVTDNKSGIELIRARADQARVSMDLFSKNVAFNTHEFNGAIRLDANELGIKKGNVKITIEAFDRSLESNGSRSTFELPVRFDAPSIEILSTQHNAERFGMEFVIYKLKGDEIAESGVQVGDKFYKGYPAYQFDGDLSAVINLYVCMYALPFEYDEEKSPLKVFATNKVGNTHTESFYYKLRERKSREWQYKVDDIKSTYFNSPSPLQKELLSIPFYDTRLWIDGIAKPYGKEASPRVGDIITVSDQSGSTKQVKFVNELIPFRLSTKSPVLATTNGIVSYVKELPGFLNVVVIDHGFGLVSLFSGLASTIISVGDKIEVNQSIGSPGFIPQLGEAGYEYGIFFQGTPVRAEEWWDKYWVRAHILDKIKEIKQRFSVTSTMSDKDLKGEDKPIERPIIRDLSDLKTNEHSPTRKDSDNQNNVNVETESYDTETLKNLEF